MRFMYDASNPVNLPMPYQRPGSLTIGYKTGIPGQNWTGYSADAWIDQAGSPGAPDYKTNVIDVEPGCYRYTDIEEWTNKCTAPVPTVYCDRSDYPNCRSVWSGAIWLAYPGATQADVNAFTMSVTGKVDENIVACQNVFVNNQYDRSDVYDPYWPDKKPEEKEMLTGQLYGGNTAFIPFPKGTFKSLIVYRDFAQVPHRMRIAIHSASRDYTVLNQVIDQDTPLTITFGESDIDAVSLVNESPFQVGWVLA